MGWLTCIQPSWALTRQTIFIQERQGIIGIKVVRGYSLTLNFKPLNELPELYRLDGEEGFTVEHIGHIITIRPHEPRFQEGVFSAAQGTQALLTVITESGKTFQVLVEATNNTEEPSLVDFEYESQPLVIAGDTGQSVDIPVPPPQEPVEGPSLEIDELDSAISTGEDQKFEIADEQGDELDSAIASGENDNYKPEDAEAAETPGEQEATTPPNVLTQQEQDLKAKLEQIRAKKQEQRKQLKQQRRRARELSKQQRKAQKAKERLHRQQQKQQQRIARLKQEIEALSDGQDTTENSDTLQYAETVKGSITNVSTEPLEEVEKEPKTLNISQYQPYELAHALRQGANIARSLKKPEIKYSRRRHSNWAKVQAAIRLLNCGMTWEQAVRKAKLNDKYAQDILNYGLTQ